MSEPRLPVVLVGAGSRSAQVYAPLLLGPLSDRLQLCALVSRGRERGQALAEQLAVPLADDLDDAVSRHGARGAIICVSSPENHKLAHQALDLSLPSLLETPLALELDDAAAAGTFSAVSATARRASAPARPHSTTPPSYAARRF